MILQLCRYDLSLHEALYNQSCDACCRSCCVGCCFGGIFYIGYDIVNGGTGICQNDNQLLTLKIRIFSVVHEIYHLIDFITA